MQPNPVRSNCQSVLLFVFLLIGLALYSCLAIFILLSSTLGFVNPQSGAGSSIGTNFIIASGLAFCAVTMLPAVIFSYQRMRGKSISSFQTRPVKVWQAIALGAGWIGAVLLSDYLYQNFSLGWLAAAPFYIISIGLPLFLLVWIGVGGIPLGSRNRFWGSLGIGMTAGPFLASLVEFFVYLGVIVMLIFIFMLNPNWLSTLQHVISQIHTATDIDGVTQILAPYLGTPLVLISLFLVLGLFTPLIEETLKPVIVWLLAKRLEGPSQGFALGVVSGAGFALVESLLASSTPGQGWGQLLAVRAGGGLMHIFASGLMGWGITSAWQGKSLRLLGTYVLSVIIHGLWNSAAIIIELGSLQPYLNKTVSSKSLDSFTLAGTIVLGLLVLLTLPALILINRNLRRPAMEILGSNAQSDIIPPPI
jgi:hypothetical protein